MKGRGGRRETEWLLVTGDVDFDWRAPRLQAVKLDDVSCGKVFLQAMINDAYVRLMTRGREGASYVATLSRSLLEKYAENLQGRALPMLLEVAVRDVLSLARATLVMLGESAETQVLDATLGAACKPCFTVVRLLIAQQAFWRESSRRAHEQAAASVQYAPEIADAQSKLKAGTMTVEQFPAIAGKILVWKEGLQPGLDERQLPIINLGKSIMRRRAFLTYK